MRELIEFGKNPLPGMYLGPINDNDPFTWQGIIEGRDDSVYAIGVFFLKIKIPLDYPFKPPKINFITRVYHPNISSDGYLCCECFNW